MLQRNRNRLRAASVILVSVAALSFFWGVAETRHGENAAMNGDYPRAAHHYARAARLLFWREDLWEKAGISASLAGGDALAISFLEKLRALSPEGWFHLGLSHYRRGDVPSAIASIERGLQAGESPPLYELLALIHREQKDWEAERFALENLVRLGTRDAYPHYRLGLLLALYAPDNALPELMHASSLDPEADSAVQTLRAALAISSALSSDAEKMITIGRALGLLQEWELSLAAFKRAAAFEPQNAEAWAWLGEAKQQTGGDGSADLERALSLGRTNPRVRALRALYWSRQGKPNQMLAEYLLAAEYDPENPAWRAGIGDAYVQLGDLVAALTAYQQAVALAPEDAAMWARLALFCVENDVYLEEFGLPAAQQAAALAPDDPYTLDVLGRAYFSSGRHASAAGAFLRAIELSPEYFPAHIHLAMNYLAQGNRAAAFNSLTYVRDADESGVYRQTAMELLARYFP
jgi:tetratricopeptide (TPR) repeat protein